MSASVSYFNYMIMEVRVTSLSLRTESFNFQGSLRQGRNIVSKKKIKKIKSLPPNVHGKRREEKGENWKGKKGKERKERKRWRQKVIVICTERDAYAKHATYADLEQVAHHP
jgi:hypothetical protein